MPVITFTISRKRITAGHVTLHCLSLLLPGPKLNTSLVDQSSEAEFKPPLSPDCRIRAAQHLLHSQLDLPIQQLAEKVNMTPRHFRRLFQQETGLCPKVYQQRVRVSVASQHIRSGRYGKLLDIAHDCGFHDQAHFITTFRQYTGQTPSAYAQRLRGR